MQGEHQKYIIQYKIHQKYNGGKKKLSAICFKAANVVPDGFSSAVPDSIGANQSKFGDVLADLFFKTDTLELENGTETSDIILGN